LAITARLAWSRPTIFQVSGCRATVFIIAMLGSGGWRPHNFR
jgi:hypothetical protein